MILLLLLLLYHYILVGKLWRHRLLASLWPECQGFDIWKLDTWKQPLCWYEHKHSSSLDLVLVGILCSMLTFSYWCILLSNNHIIPPWNDKSMKCCKKQLTSEPLLFNFLLVIVLEIYFLHKLQLFLILYHSPRTWPSFFLFLSELNGLLLGIDFLVCGASPILIG